MAERKISKRTIRILAAVIALGAAGFAFYARMRSATQGSDRKQMAPLVQIQKPAVEDFHRTLAVNGDVLPVQQANIFSRVSGNVLAMDADIGAFVRRGQLLAVIDTTQYVESARQDAAQLAQARAALQNAQATYERSAQLHEKNLISQQDYDNSQAAYRAAQAQADAAKAVLANARLTLGYCRIIAPFSGYITKRFVDPGVYIATSPQNNSTLYTLMDMRTVKIYVNIQEQDVPIVNAISGATVRVDAYKDSLFHGAIAKTNQALDMATRTLAVEVDVDNPSRTLKPGMFATVSFISATHPHAIVIPSDAVQTDDQGKYVFAVVYGKAKRMDVQTGFEQDNKTEVLSGVQPDEDIIVLGEQLVKDGMPVRVTAQ